MVAAVHSAPPYRILISDDDAACRESVSDALASNGYATHLASSGREAIELVQQHLVHVMIVDMHMPDMSGLETVTIIRHEVSPAVPSILISADTSGDLMRQALAAEFESFMPKPLNLSVLRYVVQEIIRRHYEAE